MTSNNMFKTSVNRLMGVKDSSHETRITPNLEHPRWDWFATLRYGFATIVQILALTGLLWAMDQLVPWLSQQGLTPPGITAIVCGFFAIMTLRSRLLSPLDNSRTGNRYASVIRPAWAPPPLAFPLVWMTIAGLRVVSAYLVWVALDQNFLSLPLVLFVVHLALGDTWNTIFTVEGRLGAAIPMVILGPLCSAIVVTLSYGQVLPLAGWILFPSCLWLTVATALVIRIWQLNGKEPLYPVVAQASDG